jgi:two-component system chemotaxis response regulator CheB
MAESVGKFGVGIILTGMGDDGATGMLAMRQRGAFTIAQDEASSVVYGMPYKAMLNGGAAKVLPLSQIAHHVCDYLQSEPAAH